MKKYNNKENNNTEKSNLTESELVSLVNQALVKSVHNNDDYIEANKDIMSQFLANPYGDEVEGQSQVVTPDISDVVESDMTSLIRVFLSSDNIVEFVPNTSNPEEIVEAREKSEYINSLIKSQDSIYKVMSDWMKSGLIHKCSAVKYFMDKQYEVDTKTYSNKDEDETIELMELLESEKYVESVDIIEKVKVEEDSEDLSLSEEKRQEIIEFIIFSSAQQGIQITPEQITEEQIESVVDELELTGRAIRNPEVFDVTFKIIKCVEVVKIVAVPTENFIITQNCQNKNDAEVVGDRVVKTRGDLLAEGYDRDLINNLPSISSSSNISNQRIDRVRNKASYGGNNDLIESSISDWASEKIEIFDLYMKVDFDGDGIAERRHILMAGSEILENEIFNHVPYSILSSITIPYELIGKSRAELAQVWQRVKSVTTRQMLDNYYMANNSRIAVNENVDLDDILNPVPNGVVRVDTENPINNDIIPISTQFTGDTSLMMLQYLDNSRANSTGNFIANQGLDKDAVGKETATRFEGVKESGAAKIELVARTFAETGFKDLFEGLCWLSSQYIDEEKEISYLNQKLLINPANWTYSHKTQPKIVNEEKMVGDLQGLLALQMQLKASQSPLVDEVKIQNTLMSMTKALGLPDTTRYFNNVEQPDQILQAQVEQLTAQLQEAQMLLQQAEDQNPFREAEQIKAEAQLIQAQAKQTMEAAKLAENKRQFDLDLQNKQEEFDEKIAAQMTEMELRFNKQMEGNNRNE